jgi:hypothetical protein
METTSGEPGGGPTRNGLPTLSYTVTVPLPLFETQNGEVALDEIPHGFIRFGS